VLEIDNLPERDYYQKALEEELLHQGKELEP
jgi:hypothetical protein